MGFLLHRHYARGEGKTHTANKTGWLPMIMPALRRNNARKMVLKTRRLFKNARTNHQHSFVKDVRHDVHRIAIPPNYRTRALANYQHEHACVRACALWNRKNQLRSNCTYAANKHKKTDAKHSLAVCKTRLRHCVVRPPQRRRHTARINELAERAHAHAIQKTTCCYSWGLWRNNNTFTPPAPSPGIVVCSISKHQHDRHTSFRADRAGVRLRAAQQHREKMPRIIVMIIVIMGRELRERARRQRAYIYKYRARTPDLYFGSVRRGQHRRVRKYRSKQEAERAYGPKRLGRMQAQRIRIVLVVRHAASASHRISRSLFHVQHNNTVCACFERA